MSLIKINIVAKADEPRALVFTNLFSRLKNVTVNGPCQAIDPAADINMFFNFSLFEEAQELFVSLLADLYEKETITIMDISKSEFNSANEAQAAAQTMCCVSANYLICSSTTVQEEVYLATGRLAPIVETPLLQTDFEEPDELVGGEPRCLWFGALAEIFTIKPYQNIKDNRVLVSVDGEPAKKTKLNFSMADFVFLPKTFSIEDEYRRLDKVELAVKKGKLVIAPDLECDTHGLALNLDLDEAISFVKTLDKETFKQLILNAQSVLLLRNNENAAVEQLIFILQDARNAHSTFTAVT